MKNKKIYMIILLLVVSTIIGCVEKENNATPDRVNEVDGVKDGQEDVFINDTKEDSPTEDVNTKDTQIPNDSNGGSNGGSNSPTSSPTSNNPTKVTIEGRKILVNNNPFTVKGTGYAPVPIGEDPESTPKDYFTIDKQGIYNRDISLLREMGANTIRLWSLNENADHTDFLNKAYNNGQDPIYVIAGMWINPYSDLSSQTVRDKIKVKFRKMVANHKNNPAIFMWVVGNELNAVYQDDDKRLDDLFSLVDEIAVEVHKEDGNHPVLTSLQDAKSIETIQKYDQKAPNIDIWAVTLFHGKTFDTYFEEYKNVSSKPFLVIEFGIDAFDHKNKIENEDAQAEYAKSLWEDIIKNSDVAMGGLHNSYSDGWSRGKDDAGTNCPDYDPAIHSDCGYPLPSTPDGFVNSEWWGIMGVKDNGNNPDIMEPRKIYYTFKELWS